MKKILIHIIFLVTPLSIIAQIKPPVAETDIVTCFFDYPVSFNALENDYGYEGDSLVILMISGVWNGDAYFEDSIIYFTPGSNSSLYLSDTVYYRVRDITTGLYSDDGKAIINFERIKSGRLDINNISAQVNCVGNQFHTLNLFDFDTPLNGFEVPKGGGVSSIINSALWIGGMDENNVIHTACERHRTGKYNYVSHKGYDFWPGPVMNTNNYNVTYLFDNNKIWELSRDEINTHKLNFDKPGYEMPENIDNWPAHGKPGSGSAQHIAPFVDLNNNGLYEPELGEYPAVKGNHSLSFIFNDDFNEHSESFGRKLGIEVFGQAYAFDCSEDSAFYNAIFFNYQVVNRSDTNYTDIYIGNYSSLFIGNGGDDLLACDTSLNAFYAFNEDDFDDTTSFYYPGYMYHPPAQAVVFLDNELKYFMYSRGYNPQNDSLFSEDPIDGHEYYNYMKSIWRDSTHLTYGGNGHIGSQSTNFALTGNPITNEGWTQMNSGIEQHALHGIASSGPYNLMTGDTISLELAYVFARDYQGDNLSSISLLKDRIESIEWFYNNDSTPCGSSWSAVNYFAEKKKGFNVYPNPAADILMLDLDIEEPELEYAIFDFIGKKVQAGIVIQNIKSISIDRLRKGYYIIRIYSGNEVLNAKFIKI